MLIDGQLTSGTLSIILGVLLQVLGDAHRAVLPSARGLIIAAALLEFYLNFFWLIADGHLDVHKALGIVFYLIVKVAFFMYAVEHIYEWTDAGLKTFQGWSFAVTGSAAMLTQAFNQPSTVWDMGFFLAAPLKSFPSSPLSGWDMVSYVIIVFSFLAIAVHILLALFEFNVARATFAPLLAMGFLGYMAFFGSGVVRWLAACLVRIFVLGIMVAITIISSAKIPALSFALADLSLDTGLTLAGTSIVLALLSWFLPSIAAGKVASGGGMGVGHLFGAGLVIAGAASRGVGVIRGVSHMVRGS